MSSLSSSALVLRLKNSQGCHLLSIVAIWSLHVHTLELGYGLLASEAIFESQNAESKLEHNDMIAKTVVSHKMQPFVLLFPHYQP